MNAQLKDEIAKILKNARLKQEHDIATIAMQIALSVTQINAIESANTKPFYNEKYFMNAVHRYADYLGVALPPSEADTSVDA